MASNISKGFEIIVSPVSGSEKNGWKICGDEILRRTVSNPIAAKKLGLSQCRPGMAVIIRPCFNEPHLGKLAYREWRSFDGGLFSEIHFVVGETPTSQKRLDSEIKLPKPPIN